jgi:FixJ family two-component response regulator
MAEGADDTIFLIDDDPGVVAALSRLIRTAGFRVEPFTSANDFLEHYSADIPGCVIIDVAMGEWYGLDLQKRLQTDEYERPVIFISGQSDLPTSVQAMKAGAVDFLTKPVNADDLFRAIALALARDQTARRDLAEKSAIRRRLDMLTPREYQVFLRVVEGKLNKQIAFELGIAEKTAKVHRARVMSKMAARNLAELVRMAEHAGITKLNSLA